MSDILKLKEVGRWRALPFLMKNYTIILQKSHRSDLFGHRIYYNVQAFKVFIPSWPRTVGRFGKTDSCYGAAKFHMLNRGKANSKAKTQFDKAGIGHVSYTIVNNLYIWPVWFLSKLRYTMLGFPISTLHFLCFPQWTFTRQGVLKGERIWDGGILYLAGSEKSGQWCYVTLLMQKIFPWDWE